MAGERLGLFDTPPNRPEILIGLSIVGLLAGAAILVLPFADIRLREIRAFIPAISSVMFVGELIIATMLFGQATMFRSRALAVLASGFLFIAVLLVGYTLTFPGVFADTGLLGADINTSAWIMIVRRLAFPILIIIYVVLRLGDRDPPHQQFTPGSRSPVYAMTAVFLAVLVIVGATEGHDLLPSMFADRTQGVYSNLLIFNVTSIVVIAASILILAFERRSVLDLWLLVALAGWLIQSVLNLALQARFTPGWYGLMLISLFADLFVLLALVAESNRLYARLARTSAERDRERDARLMSMDAVAASISHEVRQPLAAVSLNALACRNWLQRNQPDIGRAVIAIDEVMESTRRTSEVLKSVRAIFDGVSESPAEFDLNVLAHETAALLSHEMTDAKIALKTSFQEGSLPLRGNRVQIQQVILNILMNAIESLVTSRRRGRSIWIRTSESDGQRVSLVVSDNGAGIPKEMVSNLFKAFQTSKFTGTGIGLSLCRTIAEDHGGSIWAMKRDKGGATFHLELPRANLQAH